MCAYSLYNVEAVCLFRIMLKLLLYRPPLNLHFVQSTYETNPQGGVNSLERLRVGERRRDTLTDVGDGKIDGESCSSGNFYSVV